MQKIGIKNEDKEIYTIQVKRSRHKIKLVPQNELKMHKCLVSDFSP